MPDVFVSEPGRPTFVGGGMAGDVPAPSVPTSPWSITTPGTQLVRVPLDVDSMVIEVWGGGGGGGTASTLVATGAPGGGGGGYAKASLGAGLYVSGSVLSVTVAAKKNPAGNGNTGNTSELICEGVSVAKCVGGAGKAGGTASVGVHAGITSITVTAGTGGSANVGAAGGAGGAAAGGGGAGGAGGASGKGGADGVAPGGGGGGGGATGSTATGWGAPGKVQITW